MKKFHTCLCQIYTLSHSKHIPRFYKLFKMNKLQILNFGMEFEIKITKKMYPKNYSN